ncbi:MAG: hypothetical protein GY913_18550 [Proteobacteria bacterium]|nr:hypothetical protein [Pseudomonadota bacterium]MCP4918911.1 hypothetical protein [Pseudomonadota bacterium]
MARDLAPLLAVLAVALFVVWPGPFGDELIGHPTGDLADHVWGTWWFGSSLLSGELPLRTAVTHLPDGGALWHPDPIGALLALPFLAFGPTVAWNTMLTLQLLVTGVLAYGMGRDVSGEPLGGVAAGITVVASPFLIGLLHSGLSEYVGLAAPVAFTWLLIRVFRGQSPAWLAGVALGVCGWQALYYPVFGALLALSMTLGHRSRLPQVATMLGVAALMTAPVALIAWSTLTDPAPAFTAAQAPGWELHRLPATDLMSWLRPGDWYHPDTPAFGNPGILHVNYVGWVVLALTGVALFRRRGLAREFPGTGLFALFALGPALSWNRTPLHLGPIPLVLPFAVLYWTPLDFVHHPYRIAAFVMPLAAVFAAIGTVALPKVLGVLAPGVLLAEFLLISPAPWPVATTAVAVSPQVLALEPGAILDWPPDATDANRRYLLAQTAHQQPVPYGINTFLPAKVRAVPVVDEALATIDVTAAARNRDVPGFVVEVDVEPSSSLAELGFSWLVLHPSEETGPAEAVFRRRLGPPQVDEDVIIWRLR